MTDTSSNNKRIAKNTMLLYFRMILTMLVTLYTSRVVLNTLGVEDFGIFNVVGGIVVMFGFLNSSMSVAVQRFMSFYMGKNDIGKLKQIFSSSVNIHLFIAILIILLAETVGLFFLYRYIDIPSSRTNAAYWVYQCSVMAFVLNILSVPYNASIIASEKMNIYAYISILEVLLKLGIVWLLQVVNVDRLKMYAVLILVVAFVIRIVYVVYCKSNLKFCKYVKVNDYSLYKAMLGHSGWMLFGTFTNMLSVQGVNILMNVFYGVSVNAARAIAVQVKSAVDLFVTNFMLAVSPQIVKRFASDDRISTFNLAFQASKIGFFLVFILVVPLIFQTEYILTLWLRQVPQHTVIFTQLVLIELCCTVHYSVLSDLIQATGKIKFYQLGVSMTFLGVFALTYVLYSLNCPVYSTFIVSIFFSIIGLLMRLMIVAHVVKLPILDYFKKVFIPLLNSSLLSVLALVLLQYSFENSYVKLLVIIVGTLIVSTFFFYLIGLNKEEKYIIQILKNKIYDKIRKVKS